MEDENLNGLEQPKRSGLDLKQKISVSVLGVFALALIFLWASDLNSTIKNFLNSGSEGSSDEVLNNLGNTCPDGNCGGSERTNIDSDNDGLLNWEETEKHGTSPYLEDTDADGYTDKEEVDSNNDPNCPRGEDCYRQEVVEDEEEEVKVNVSEEIDIPKAPSNLGSDMGLNTDNLNIEDSSVQGIMGGKASPDELREMLRQAGIDEAMLGAVSDEELMQVYSETLSQNNGG